MTNAPAVLLYGFSAGEAVQLQGLIPGSPVQVISVPSSKHAMTLEDVLANKAPPALLTAVPVPAKTLVLANVQGPLLSFLLSACKQVTGDQHVLRALLTDTNRTWTGVELCRHLLEEEAELRAMGAM